MPDYILPSNAALMMVEQQLMPTLTMDDWAFKLFPIVNQDEHLLMWEQLDNYLGLQQVRGLDGEPARVAKRGFKRYEMEPGVYGEFITLTERELTVMRVPGTFATPVNLTGIIAPKQMQLLNRRIDRLRYIIWTLLSTGTFAISNAHGVQHTDTYPIQTFTAGVTWATVATATPLQNFRSVQLLGRGSSSKFGAQAYAFANRATINNLLANTNAADLYGRRVTGLATANNLADVNTLLLREDLPQLVVYDEGYLDDSGTFQLFIPNNKVIVVGSRPAGQTIGEYRMTRNANNPDMAPGAYMRVIDHGEDKVPRRIEIHDGHNGGPVIYFPSAVVVMTV